MNLVVTYAELLCNFYSFKSHNIIGHSNRQLEKSTVAFSSWAEQYAILKHETSTPDLIQYHNNNNTPGHSGVEAQFGLGGAAPHATRGDW